MSKRIIPIRFGGREYQAGQIIAQQDGRSFAEAIRELIRAEAKRRGIWAALAGGEAGEKVQVQPQ